MFVEINNVEPIATLAWYTCAPGSQAAGAAGQRWYTAQVAYRAGAHNVTVRRWSPCLPGASAALRRPQACSARQPKDLKPWRPIASSLPHQRVSPCAPLSRHPCRTHFAVMTTTPFGQRARVAFHPLCQRRHGALPQQPLTSRRTLRGAAAYQRNRRTFSRGAHVVAGRARNLPPQADRRALRQLPGATTIDVPPPACVRRQTRRAPHPVHPHLIGRKNAVGPQASSSAHLQLHNGPQRWRSSVRWFGGD